MKVFDGHGQLHGAFRFEAPPHSQPVGELGAGQTARMAEDVRDHGPQAGLQAGSERQQVREGPLDAARLALAQETGTAEIHSGYLPWVPAPAPSRRPSALTLTVTTLSTRRNMTLGFFRPHST